MSRWAVISDSSMDGIYVEHADKFGGQHYFADRAAGEIRGVEDDFFLAFADQARGPGQGGAGAKTLKFGGLVTCAGPGRRFFGGVRSSS